MIYRPTKKEKKETPEKSDLTRNRLKGKCHAAQNHFHY